MDCNTTENDTFFKIKEKYREARKSEASHIVGCLKDFFINSEMKVSMRSGKANYKGGSKFLVPHDLTNWIYVDFRLDNFNAIISLQTFDYDEKTGNMHILMDRIGIYAYAGNSLEDYSNEDAYKKMMITDIELPLDKNKTEKLCNLIKELSKAEYFNEEKNLKDIYNKYNLV